MPAYADGFEHFGTNYAVPALFLADVPQLVRRHRLCRHRHWRAGAGRDHVDRLRQSLHPQHLQGIHQSRLHAARESQVAKIVSLVVKVGALFFVLGAEAQLCDPAAAAGRHLDHPDAAGGADRALHPLAQSLGAVGRLGLRHRRRHGDGREPGLQGLDLCAALFGVTIPCYAALSSLMLNLGGERGVEPGVQPRRARTPRRRDRGRRITRVSRSGR